MKRGYNIGDKFRLSPNAIENYGDKYLGRKFTVSGWFSHYAKPGSCDPHGHPGFDKYAGSCLYESESLNFAVYEWEMEHAS